MALQRQDVDIALGEGVSEGVGAKLLQAPKLLELVDARWDKRGELAKRFGATVALNTDLDTAATPNSVFDHNGALAQYRSDGTAVWDVSRSAWATDGDGPRPSRVITDPIVRGNGNYKDASVAYEPTSGIACVVYRDESLTRVFALFVHAASGAVLNGGRPVEMSTSILFTPLVLAFGGRFLVLGFDASNDIYAASYQAAAGTYTFAAAVLVHTTGTEEHFSATVASSTETHAHVAVALGTGGYVVYQVTNTGTVVDSIANPASAEAACIAVCHNPATGNVYVLHHDTGPATPQLSLGVFPDDYSTDPPSAIKVLDYAVSPTAGYARRCTLALGSGNALWCFASHSEADAVDRGGVDFRAVNSSGTPQGTAGHMPNLILATQALADADERVIVGVAREVDFAVTGDATFEEAEPLTSGFLVTPITTSSGDESLAVIGRFGHDRFSNTIVTDVYLGALVEVGSELWAAYTVIVSSNPGSQSAAAFGGPTKALQYGWQWGIDVLHADLVPSPVEHASAEGLALHGGGVLASFDGQRSTELAIPVVPHAPYGMAIGNGAFVTACVGAAGTSYTFEGALALFPGLTATGTGYVIVGEASFKYCLRWIDAQGNLRRSSMSGELTRAWLVAAQASAGVVDAFDQEAVYYDTATNVLDAERDSRVLFVPVPSPTALQFGDTKFQVELYRTGFSYTAYDSIAAGDDVVLDTIEGDSTFRLCGVVDLGEVTGYPGLAWIEDPAIDVYYISSTGSESGGPTPSAPQPYTESELASEPIGPILDICSTQQRLFAIDAEDRLSVLYTKPFASGYAPEWNAALAIRCAAEGGDLVAIETLDDKLVLFKERRIYVTPVLSGPDATGEGVAFDPPRELASDTGCVNPRCVAKGPWGVVFESARGIELLGRDLAITWIGEAVKDSLDGETIVAAVVVPDATEVRFQLAAEVDADPLPGARFTWAVAWDYRLNQWSVWEELEGLHAALWDGVYTRLLSTGDVRYDNEASYDGPGERPMLSLTTAWIKLAGLQGYKRVWKSTFLGDYYTGDLTIDVGYDYETSWDESYDFTESELEAMWTVAPQWQLQITPGRQKCQAIRFRVRERDLTSGGQGGTPPTAGRGLVLQGLRLRCGIRQGTFKHIPSGSKR